MINVGATAAGFRSSTQPTRRDLVSQSGLVARVRPIAPCGGARGLNPLSGAIDSGYCGWESRQSVSRSLIDYNCVPRS